MSNLSLTFVQLERVRPSPVRLHTLSPFFHSALLVWIACAAGPGRRRALPRQSQVIKHVVVNYTKPKKRLLKLFNLLERKKGKAARKGSHSILHGRRPRAIQLLRLVEKRKEGGSGRRRDALQGGEDMMVLFFDGRLF